MVLFRSRNIAVRPNLYCITAYYIQRENSTLVVYIQSRRDTTDEICCNNNNQNNNYNIIYSALLFHFMYSCIHVTRVVIMGVHCAMLLSRPKCIKPDRGNACRVNNIIYKCECECVCVCTIFYV